MGNPSPVGERPPTSSAAGEGTDEISASAAPHRPRFARRPLPRKRLWIPHKSQCTKGRGGDRQRDLAVI
jgi:hypothetical protein